MSAHPEVNPKDKLREAVEAAWSLLKGYEEMFNMLGMSTSIRHQNVKELLREALKQ